MTPKHRLQGYSTEPLVNRWETIATEIAYRKKLAGRKLKPGPLLNAIVLWWLDLPTAEQNRIAVEGLAKLEAHLATPDDEAEPEPPAPKGKGSPKAPPKGKK